MRFFLLFALALGLLTRVCVASEKQQTEELAAIIKCIGEKKYAVLKRKNSTLYYDSLLLTAARKFIQRAQINSNAYCKQIDATKQSAADNFYLMQPYTYVNEYDYSNLGLFPNTEYRLLALANFWNAINQLHPYKHLFADNWDSTLIKFIPLVIHAADAVSYHTVMMKLTALLNDAHGFFITTLSDTIFGKYRFPFYLRYINDSLVVYDLFDNIEKDPIDIQLGDVIVEIDNQSVAEKAKEILPFLSGANHSVIQDRLAYFMAQSHDSIATLKIIRQKREQYITVKKYLVEQIIYKHSLIKDSLIENASGDIRYVNLKYSGLNTILENNTTRKLIFDLRYGVEKDTNLKKLLAKKFSFRKIYVGQYIFPKYAHSDKIFAKPLKKKYQNTAIVVLVSESTQSSSEFIAIYLSAYKNVKVVGTQTAGALGDIAMMNLPGKITIVFTRSEFIAQASGQIYKHGVKIDILVNEQTSDVAPNNNAYLRTAIKFLNNESTIMEKNPEQ